MTKLAVADWCLDSQGAQALDQAARLGLDGIHLGFTEPGDEGLPLQAGWREDIRQACERTGSQVFCIAVNVVERYGLFTSAGRSRCAAAVRNALHAAELLGVPLVYMPSFHQCEISSPEALKQTASFLQDMSRSLTGEVLLASENTLGAADNLRLVEQVGCERFRVLLDIYNPRLWGHCPAEIARQLKPWLAPQVHVKDGSNGAMGNARLGQGDGQIDATLQVLATNGAVEVLVLENDYRKHPGPQVSADISYLARHFPMACRKPFSVAASRQWAPTIN